MRRRAQVVLLAYRPAGQSRLCSEQIAHEALVRGSGRGWWALHHEFLLTRYVARWFAGNRVDASPARQRIGGLR